MEKKRSARTFREKNCANFDGEKLFMHLAKLSSITFDCFSFQFCLRMCHTTQLSTAKRRFSLEDEIENQSIDATLVVEAGAAYPSCFPFHLLVDFRSRQLIRLFHF